MVRVLVLGASSYVAQFLLQRLVRDASDGDGGAERMRVACTLRGRAFSPLPIGFKAATKNLGMSASDAEEAGVLVQVYWEVDVLDAKALQNCVDDFRPTDIINCAALSSPAVCQKSPEKAHAINEPYHLVELLEQLPWPVRLVHFSTDFVYDGTKPIGESYDEDEAVASPLLSEYGAGKLRFDRFLQERSLQSVVLRIANVLGPPATLFPDQTNPPKFMEWLHAQLFQDDAPGGTQQPPLKLWSDEFRSFVYIHDLVAVAIELLKFGPDLGSGLFNVGGVEALSRVELAQQYLDVCKAHDVDRTAARTREIVPTERVIVDLGYPSPLNTRLSTSRLSKLLLTFDWKATHEFLDEICRARFVQDDEAKAVRSGALSSETMK